MNRVTIALPLLVAIVLLCFAGNSVLNRAAVGAGRIDPLMFSLLRVASGAVALGLLVALRDRTLRLRGRLAGALALTLYMIGFSLAYLSLDSGVGALILFGGVQIVMFSGAALSREPLPLTRWIGAAIALGGLLVLLWPRGGTAPSMAHGALMAMAALGWGAYSLIGRRTGDPLGTTAASFILSAPLVAAALLLTIPATAPATPDGIALAVLSGVVTSGLGYALWYAVLPRLTSAGAALLQLLVPVLATLGGVLLLGEPLTGRLALAGVLVLGGIALGVRRP
ncbi:DMT family transporter [Oceaniglobus trochenteri]|uniref:DMT family transporter n=1 Tax=Oceaniglobus trochenteri TaxID=2763260 RepID=UPI001CFFE11F|nr:DMT family transporter [Oceaniglobus trochenteri]